MPNKGRQPNENTPSNTIASRCHAITARRCALHVTRVDLAISVLLTVLALSCHATGVQGEREFKCRRQSALCTRTTPAAHKAECRAVPREAAARARRLPLHGLPQPIDRIPLVPLARLFDAESTNRLVVHVFVPHGSHQGIVLAILQTCGTQQSQG